MFLQCPDIFKARSGTVGTAGWWDACAMRVAPASKFLMFCWFATSEHKRHLLFCLSRFNLIPRGNRCAGVVNPHYDSYGLYICDTKNVYKPSDPSAISNCERESAKILPCRRKYYMRLKPLSMEPFTLCLTSCECNLFQSVSRKQEVQVT